jgi:hypothetical protein
MNALVQYNTLPSISEPSSSSSLPFCTTIMMSPSSSSLFSHCEPRRVSLDEVSLKEQIAHLVSDDESDDDEDAIIPTSCGWTVGKKRRIEAISKPASSSSSTASLKSCLARNNKKAKVLIVNNSNKTRKLLRFLAEPIVLGCSADVQMENAHNVWYTKPELSAIRRECKLAIVQGVVSRRNGQQPSSSSSSDSLQLRGLERWTSRVQYHARQMASKTLRSELYIEQSSQRLFLDNIHTTSTASIIMSSSNPQERLAEISRQHSAQAVASALCLAQVDAAC